MKRFIARHTTGPWIPYTRPPFLEQGPRQETVSVDAARVLRAPGWACHHCREEDGHAFKGEGPPRRSPGSGPDTERSPEPPTDDHPRSNGRRGRIGPSWDRRLGSR